MIQAACGFEWLTSMRAILTLATANPSLLVSSFSKVTAGGAGLPTAAVLAKTHVALTPLTSEQTVYRPGVEFDATSLVATSVVESMFSMWNARIDGLGTSYKLIMPKPPWKGVFFPGMPPSSNTSDGLQDEQPGVLKGGHSMEPWCT